MDDVTALRRQIDRLRADLDALDVRVRSLETEERAANSWDEAEETLKRFCAMHGLESDA